MAPQVKLKSRYEIKETLGQGGMGVVFKAFDALIKRDVALKTIRDAPDPAALENFYKECGVLASMAHPNIIEIFDLGEFEENGANKPYFVMPLLPGVTLEALIRTSSQCLSVERAVDIIGQTCRGLQAAHERGLVHRDLKPSNIFVMEDDSVKIIDFGVAHIIDTHTMNLKGTLAYMAPEQIEMKPLSALSDIFSLGVVAYEALTLRRPFQGRTQAEVVEAILKQNPPPASDLNPAVGQTISRVIHKALAKHPWHRFPTAREFAEILQNALRNEPIEIFDPARIQPRIQRAAKAFEQDDYQFAAEILGELEGEGHLDPAILTLRRQINQTIRRKTILQLLQNARTRFEEQEYPLALQKIQEVLQLDPNSAEALRLKSDIENRRTVEKIDDWFRLARQHIDNYAFGHAREALKNVLQLRPSDTQALQLLSEVGRREQEYLKGRQEKQSLYQQALEIWQNGEVSAALSKLEQVLELDRRAPDLSAPEGGTLYQNFYNQVRSEHDAIESAYAEARRHLAERNYTSALLICDQLLTKYPGHALFQALRFDLEEQQRQELSGQIAEINRRVEVEPDLDRRVSILREAVDRYPEEAYFASALRLMNDKRDLVNSIVAKARLLEEQGQFNEALAQWEILRTIYNSYPGLSFEVERVVSRRDQQIRAAAKARWVEQIDLHLESGDYNRANDLLRQAQQEFPMDSELEALQKLVVQGLERAAEAQRLLIQGQELCAQVRVEEGLDVLWRARRLDERNAIIRAVLVNTLLERARILLDSDWRSAETLIEHAVDLDTSNSLAMSLRTLASDRKREEFISSYISQARQSQTAGDLKAALAFVEQGLAAYPREFRLLQLQATLSKGLDESRRRSLDELKQISRGSERVADPALLETQAERVRTLASQFSDDPEFQKVATDLEQRLATMTLNLESTAGAPLSQISSAERQLSEIVAPLGASPTGDEGSVEHGRIERSLLQPSVGPIDEGTEIQQGLPPSETFSGGNRAVAFRLDQSNVDAESATRSPRVADASAEDSGSHGMQTRRQSGQRWILSGIAALILISLAVTWLIRDKTSGSSAAVIPLEVHTSPSGAKVIINDQIRGTSNLKIELAPGTYQIRAELEGYEPASVSLDLSPAETASPVDLLLRPLVPPTVASEENAATQAPVQTPPAGKAKDARLPAQPKAVSLSLPTGIPSRPTVGALRLKRSPESSEVTIQNVEDSEARKITADELELPTGSYTLTATASGHEPLSTAVSIEAGRTQEVSLVLERAKVSECDWNAYWENPAGWISEGEWLVHRGGNFVLSRIQPANGSFVFTVWRKSKSVQWVVNYTDEKNYDLFEIDKKSFHRSAIRNGKKTQTVKVPHGVGDQSLYHLQITVETERVVHKIHSGEAWTTLDDWKNTDRSLANGKFGFRIPGKDQVGISHFSFKPH